LSNRAAIILAAGKSTRMGGSLPKVLHEICGKSMLSLVLQACRLAGVERTVVVIGHGRDQVKEAYALEDGIEWVEQDEQKGTGHAVLCCREAFADFDGSLMIIAGDMPLVRWTTLSELMEAREKSGDAACLATTILDNPTGYGRIVRDDSGRLMAIVEHKVCTPEQLEIREVNPSYYVFDAGRLFSALSGVAANPETGEYYITDVVSALRENGDSISAITTVPAEDAIGVNSRLDLALVARVMQDRIQLSLMNDGVSIVDPDNTWIEAEATIGPDTVVLPFSFIGAGAVVGGDCRIGPFASVAPGEQVADGTRIGSAASVA